MKISITIKTGARQTKIEETEDGYTAYVKERPVENRANRALIDMLSELFDIPKFHSIKPVLL